MEYVLGIVILTCIFALLTVSLDLIAGHAGVLSLTHAGFYGIGAYASALLSVNTNAPFLVGMLAGIVVAIAVSFIISFPSLRVHDDYFVIATFGFQMILFSLLNNWIELTAGPLGIPGIPAPDLFGWRADTSLQFLALAGGVVAVGYFAVLRIAASPFGRVLHAIREDETFAHSLGKSLLYFKVTTFAVSAGLAATAGTLYAHYVTYIDPTSFTVMESILIVSMVIIGGAGSRWGPILGAGLLVLLPEALRFAGLESVSAANLRQLVYGALLVVMMMFRPQGLVGRYGFRQ